MWSNPSLVDFSQAKGNFQKNILYLLLKFIKIYSHILFKSLNSRLALLGIIGSQGMMTIIKLILRNSSHFSLILKTFIHFSSRDSNLAFVSIFCHLLPISFNLSKSILFQQLKLKATIISCQLQLSFNPKRKRVFQFKFLLKSKREKDEVFDFLLRLHLHHDWGKWKSV